MRAALALLLLGCSATVAPGPKNAPDSGPTDCPADTCGERCVDLSTDPLNCGSCGRTCLIPEADAACLAGACAIGACSPGFLDCDGSLDNGCEAPDACEPGAACATACGSLGATDCSDACAPTCLTSAETCNASDDDCNGACDEGLGCRIDVYRSGGAHGHIYGLDPAEAANAGQSMEGDPYFYVYASETVGLSPLYRCDKGSGLRFLTLSATCEIGLPVDLLVGYVATTPVCGAIPLHRLYNGTTGDHFYTTSEGERDNAIAAYGYSSEGIAAYVWAEP